MFTWFEKLSTLSKSKALYRMTSRPSIKELPNPLYRKEFKYPPVAINHFNKSEPYAWSVEAPKTELLDELNQIGEKGGNINGIFKPSKNGLIGQGSFTLIYKGT